MKIEELCERKEQELLKKYFGDLVKKAAVERPETIKHYTKDLPLKIEDVTYYKGLLLEYTRDLLMVMRIDFLEEITGRHIRKNSIERH